MTPIISASTSIDNINRHQLSDSHFDRHIRTRLDVMDLFLRVAFKAGLELLRAVALVLLATLKWILKKVDRSHLLTASIDFGKITAYLNQSKQCATALICDFPAIFIDPKTTQTKLLNRQLIHVDIPQPRGALFVSLANYLWTHRAASIGTTTAILTTAVAIYRLGFFNPTPIPSPLPPIPQPSLPSIGPWVLIPVVISIGVIRAAFDNVVIPTYKWATLSPYDLSLFYTRRENFSEASKHMEVAADQGHPIALRHMYTHKYIQQESPDRLHYLQFAAAENIPEAQYLLGLDYESGEGVEKNLQTALYYFKLAASQQPGSYSDRAHDAVKRVTQNFEVAARAGNPDALTYMFFDRYPVAGTQERLEFLLIGIEHGNQEAQYLLGVDHENGTGVEKCLKTALFYYLLAAHQKDGNYTNSAKLAEKRLTDKAFSEEEGVIAF